MFEKIKAFFEEIRGLSLNDIIAKIWEMIIQPA